MGYWRFMKWQEVDLFDRKSHNDIYPYYTRLAKSFDSYLDP